MGNLKFGDRGDRCFRGLGYILAFINGFLGASHAYIIAELIVAFNPYDPKVQEIDDVLLYAVPLIAEMIILSYLQTYLLQRSAARAGYTLRKELFRSLCS